MDVIGQIEIKRPTNVKAFAKLQSALTDNTVTVKIMKYQIKNTPRRSNFVKKRVQEQPVLNR